MDFTDMDHPLDCDSRAHLSIDFFLNAPYCISAQIGHIRIHQLECYCILLDHCHDVCKLLVVLWY